VTGTAANVVTYGVRRRTLFALFAGAGAAGWLAMVSVPPGRLFYLILAAGALVEGLRGLKPTLVAGPDGFDVSFGLRHESHAWDEVERVCPLDPPSGGAGPRRRAKALEIDLGERLVLVPAYRLGAPVPDVVTALEMLRG
jgi:hypothetical protein